MSISRRQFMQSKLDPPIDYWSDSEILILTTRRETPENNS